MVDILNLELGWETISERGDILCLSFFHKIHVGETRPLIKGCMPKVNFGQNRKTRSKIGYVPDRFKKRPILKSLSFQHIKTLE